MFKIKGQYAHFKKIYATTSAVSYMVPPKTTLYGYLGAILGLDKKKYLASFQDKNCLIGLQICKPIIMQRINTNLRPVLGRLSQNGNRKPTTMEYVYQPDYQIFVSHSDDNLMKQLETNIKNKTPVYTPTLGLANLISVMEWIGNYQSENITPIESVNIDSVIPRKKFIQLEYQDILENENQIVEQSLYAVEMDLKRNVTERDDIILDRNAKSIKAFVTDFYRVSNQNIILF